MKQGEINGHLANLIDQVDSLDGKMDDVRERIIKVESHLKAQNGRVERNEGEIEFLWKEINNNIKFRYLLFGALLVLNVLATIYLNNGGVLIGG